jgi:hypothetical protein
MNVIGLPFYVYIAFAGVTDTLPVEGQRADPGFEVIGTYYLGPGISKIQGREQKLEKKGGSGWFARIK